MTDIAINTCFGGFSLSTIAVERLKELGSAAAAQYPHYKSRSDPLLIQVIRELGAAANGSFASIEIVEVPDDVEWEIPEYDGMEHVAEVHRTWHT